MGIQVIQAPQGAVGETPGPLNLPVEFDRKKHAAKWVKEGPAVAAASEREWIPSTNLSADGWEVWRHPETKKPHKVALQSGTHVLLFRSRDVQDAVNAICGNIGKERLSNERKGETVAGATPNDPGMLSDDKLNKVMGMEESDEGDVDPNPVPGENSGGRVTKSTVKLAGTRRSRRQ